MTGLRPSLVAIAVGLGVIVVGAVVLLAPLFEAARWQTSPDAQRAQRNADVTTPIWVLTPIAGHQTAAVPSRVNPDMVSVRATPTPIGLGPKIGLQAHVAEAPTPTLTPSDLELKSAAFAFVDPPEPGAHARLSVTVHNPTDRASGRLVLTLPASWLAGYRIDATSPSLVDGLQDGEVVRLGFGGPEPGSDFELSVDVTTIDEVIDAPALTVLDGEGREVGQAHPPTRAPPAQPGPVYSIDIPKLRLHSGVVPVDWEPPLFVVGQVRTSAYVTQGNTVLIGHLRGVAGYNVFDHLDKLTPGDEIVASSRGQKYTFVVTDTEVLPEDDASPTLASPWPRLTLMTCAGDWNPLTRDYPERLWVIAEPPSAVHPSQSPRPGRLHRAGGL